MTGNSTVAVILAAGLSSRFPGDKLLHPLGGKPLAAHVADTLLDVSLDHRLSVCPSDNAARTELFAGRGYDIVVNPDPERGMASSLAVAAERAIALDADWLLVCLADMPNVTADHLGRLLATGALAATGIDGRIGPPAVFPRDLLPQLTQLTGDKGACDLLAGAIPIAADAELGRDFDTPADFG